jgi:hypothetical protein
MDFARSKHTTRVADDDDDGAAPAESDPDDIEDSSDGVRSAALAGAGADVDG